jgi:hypothetical protein
LSYVVKEGRGVKMDVEGSFITNAEGDVGRASTNGTPDHALA